MFFLSVCVGAVWLRDDKSNSTSFCSNSTFLFLDCRKLEVIALKPSALENMNVYKYVVIVIYDAK